MDDSVRLLVGAKCDAELDLVKQAVISHEHGERKKEKKKRKAKDLCTSFFWRLSRLSDYVVHYCCEHQRIMEGCPLLLKESTERWVAVTFPHIGICSRFPVKSSPMMPLIIMPFPRFKDSSPVEAHLGLSMRRARFCRCRGSENTRRGAILNILVTVLICKVGLQNVNMSSTVAC